MKYSNEQKDGMKALLKAFKNNSHTVGEYRRLKETYEQITRTQKKSRSLGSRLTTASDCVIPFIEKYVSIENQRIRLREE